MKLFKNFSFAAALIAATALLIAAFITFFSYAGCTSREDSKVKVMDTSTVASVQAVELKTGMRKLWEDHVTWTRNVILCLVDDVPGTDQALQRLLQNQVDIGNAMKPYYGEEAGNQLTELLKTHISIAGEVVKAAKSGNTASTDEASKRWYANADEISAFLAKANPNWQLAEMKMMMNDHLKLTTDEAVQRIKKDWAADVAAYDRVHDEILKMADMLTEGIILQFPAKFGNEPGKEGSK